MPRARGRGRGRGGRGGRGGSRGRGASRGRGGSRGRRSFRGGRGGGNRSGGERTEPKVEIVDIDTHPKEFFVGVVSTQEHLNAQEKNRSRYAAVLHTLQNNHVTIAQSKNEEIIHFFFFFLYI